ncbi:MAG: XRE family transcriptional regulator [Candidatus Harrisonbacteria bacterium CG10_big_fil_rev_8_21_14_0_10_49_15]|uniref:XRE family transcriptional regulator n=1 Tax=Candidatus Harrisonbacteria bacterium CG10_big_fil_rev_8_21_14_0_10_49_15 TaxID=1974587 RepID=A0A2H0UM39_9BACT|nr:MAG: XRE family transcriptional regulator [Candidatus Harrisonbacteria bacterium CG10_big_fil_rev_8_21_14_0_10_49_15]
MAELLKNKRKKLGLSQEDLAGMLGISRPTLNKVEKGERKLTVEEKKKLAEISSSFDWEKQAQNMRINIPQEYADKFEQTLLYVLGKIGGKPNIGQTVIYKLLYFIDFDYYEKYEEQLMGARYIKNHHGPTPVMFAEFIERLEKQGKVERIKSKFYKYEQTKYLINPERTLDLSALSAQELAHIDWELNRLSDLTATQISALSHLDTPWKVAKDRGVLEYEHVFYRPDETSVREYEPL